METTLSRYLGRDQKNGMNKIVTKICRSIGVVKKDEVVNITMAHDDLHRLFCRFDGSSVSTFIPLSVRPSDVCLGILKLYIILSQVFDTDSAKTKIIFAISQAILLVHY